MKKIVIFYGLMSGAVLALFTAVVFPIAWSRDADMAGSQIVGFSVMIMAFLAVFFGIRSYRENVGGGAITFGKAFQVGILVALIGSAMYVAGWQVAYWGFVPDFGEKYAEARLSKMRDEGASDQEIATEAKSLEEFKRMYKNPLFNVAITFMEVLPVGLIVTLVSAAILRKKRNLSPAVA